MWIYTFAPDWAIHATTLLGVLGLIASAVLSFIPFIRQYRLPLQIISALVTALGIYLQGGLADNKEWQARVAELETELAQARIDSRDRNTQIQDKVVTKTEYIRERGRDVIKYVDKIVTQEILKEVPGPERERMVEVIKYIEDCKVPQELIDIHNKAARINKEPER